jgi:hypothetical protein
MGKLFLMPSYIFLERPLYLLLFSRSRRRKQTTDAIRARFWQFTDWDAAAYCAFLSDVVSYLWVTAVHAQTPAGRGFGNDRQLPERRPNRTSDVATERGPGPDSKARKYTKETRLCQSF